MTHDPWWQLADLARLAPTPHNTQPFRLRPRGDEADLVLLTERLLPREDHGNAYMLGAFGIFAATLERAAEHLGLGLELVVGPAPTVDELAAPAARVVLGRARLTGRRPPRPQADLLRVRRTSRLPFDGRLVDPADRHALRSVAHDHGHRFVDRSEPRFVRDILRLNAAAIIDNLQIDAEREEIRRWYRFGPTPTHGDGLWQEPLRQPGWQTRLAFAAPWLFRLPVVRQLATASFVRTQRGTCHVAAVCGPFGTFTEQVAAGRMLLDLWLTMAARGIYMHPYGSTLTSPRHARLVADRFGVDDCFLLLRFGHGAPPPAAPRLPPELLDA